MMKKCIRIELFLFFHFTCDAANASELFCMLANNERFSYHFNLSFETPNFMNVNSQAWVDENKLKCEKIRFF